MRALLSDRNTRLYLTGQVLSLFGDSAMWLAIAIWIKVLTGSSAAPRRMSARYPQRNCLLICGHSAFQRLPLLRTFLAVQLFKNQEAS